MGQVARKEGDLPRGPPKGIAARRACAYDAELFGKASAASPRHAGPEGQSTYSVAGRSRLGEVHPTAIHPPQFARSCISPRSSTTPIWASAATDRSARVFST